MGNFIALGLVFLLGLIYTLTIGYGVKYTFTGQSMIKYKVIAYLVKIGLFIGYILVITPFVAEITNHINTAEVINYWHIAGQWGRMALWLIAATVVETIFAFVILIPAAKSIEGM